MAAQAEQRSTIGPGEVAGDSSAMVPRRPGGARHHLGKIAHRGRRERQQRAASFRSSRGLRTWPRRAALLERSEIK